MYEYEQECFRQGMHTVCGIDEAGRGPLAGPVVAGAVILDPNYTIEGLNDSKQLSAKKREFLEKEIKSHALAYGIGYVFEDEIDRINIYNASRLAMTKAIEAMAIRPDFVLSDAMPMHELGIPFLAIIKGDTLSASIAAASILAKVSRDEYMQKMAQTYPQYGFDIHKGYPTKMHLEALKKYGACPIHRRTYQPVKDTLLEQQKLEF